MGFPWLLNSTLGIGTLSGMEILVELQEITRFKTADELAANPGLPPLSTPVDSISGLGI
jgi:hypothetical protein